MINYRIGGRASGKTFRLMKKLSGKEFLFLESDEIKAKNIKYLLNNSEYFRGVSNLSKAKVTTLFDYMLGDFDDINIIVIEDFNEFISSIFKDKEVYININNKEHNVKIIDVENERWEHL